MLVQPKRDKPRAWTNNYSVCLIRNTCIACGVVSMSQPLLASKPDVLIIKPPANAYKEQKCAKEETKQRRIKQENDYSTSPATR